MLSNKRRAVVADNPYLFIQYHISNTYPIRCIYHPGFHRGPYACLRISQFATISCFIICGCLNSSLPLISPLFAHWSTGKDLKYFFSILASITPHYYCWYFIFSYLDAPYFGSFFFLHRLANNLLRHISFKPSAFEFHAWHNANRACDCYRTKSKGHWCMYCCKHHDLVDTLCSCQFLYISVTFQGMTHFILLKYKSKRVTCYNYDCHYN